MTSKFKMYAAVYYVVGDVVRYGEVVSIKESGEASYCGDTVVTYEVSPYCSVYRTIDIPDRMFETSNQALEHAIENMESRIKLLKSQINNTATEKKSLSTS